MLDALELGASEVEVLELEALEVEVLELEALEVEALEREAMDFPRVALGRCRQVVRNAVREEVSTHRANGYR